MTFIELLSSFASITGVSFITIITVFFTLFSKRLTRKRFNFTKETVYKCTKGYIEPIYEIDKIIQTDNILKKIKEMVIGLSSCKIIYLIGDSGAGKTYLTNCFIWKYDTYFRLKGKKIIRIFGLDSENILEVIKAIENKDNTILIIDGLEEAYIYKRNVLSQLPKINDILLPYYCVLITININFYNQNSQTLNRIFYRNAEQKKIFPSIIYLKPFSPTLIEKYIGKNMKLSPKDKIMLINKTIQNIKIFSNPLLLYYITKFNFKEADISTRLDILNHILESSLEWEEEKFSTTDNSVKFREEVLSIMNRISWLYICGKKPVIKSTRVIHNDLLIYDKRKQEYRFSHNLFLCYKCIQKFYSKLANEKFYSNYIEANPDLRNLYFARLMQRHNHLIINNESISIELDINPTLEIKDVCVFSERWLLGLSKSLLNNDVVICNLVLKAHHIYRIAKQYIQHNHLDLQGIDINEKQLTWWTRLPLKSLNISNTKIHSITISDSWSSIQSFCGQNIPLEAYTFLNKLPRLKELDLSGVQINNIKDFQNLTKLPDYISIDLANCGITNDNLPRFLFATTFKNIYLDYNWIQNINFISKIKFDYMNISNNPIKISEDKFFEYKKIQCDFYFEDDEITKLLCNDKTFLTYEQATTVNLVDISKLLVKNINGLEYMPNLKTIIINIYQTPLINNLFEYSQLENITIVTYGLPILRDSLLAFYPALKTIYSNTRDYGAICSAAKCIMRYTFIIVSSFSMKFKYKINGQLGNDNCAATTGTESLVNYMNIDLALFFRRVVDTFNFAMKFWDGDIDYEDTTYEKSKSPIPFGSELRFNYNSIAKHNYNNELNELYNLLDLEPVPPVQSEYTLLNFFFPIHNVLKQVHTQPEMETILSNRVGRKINVHYIFNTEP